jgi:hypothetical protein
MKVFELIEMLKDVDVNSDIKIMIESGRSLSISDDVSVWYDEENKEFKIEGEESDWD